MVFARKHFIAPVPQILSDGPRKQFELSDVRFKLVIPGVPSHVPRQLVHLSNSAHFITGLLERFTLSLVSQRSCLQWRCVSSSPIKSMKYITNSSNLRPVGCFNWFVHRLRNIFGPSSGGRSLPDQDELKCCCSIAFGHRCWILRKRVRAVASFSVSGPLPLGSREAFSQKPVGCLNWLVDRLPDIFHHSSGGRSLPDEKPAFCCSIA